MYSNGDLPYSLFIARMGFEVLLLSAFIKELIYRIMSKSASVPNWVFTSPFYARYLHWRASDTVSMMEKSNSFFAIPIEVMNFLFPLKDFQS